MDEEVSWLVELTVKPGELDNLRALMAEMVASTRDEAGTIAYQWYVSSDGSTVHVYEWYATSAAVMTHLQSFGSKFAERFFAAVDLTRWMIYGTPSAEVKSALNTFGPTYLGPFGGFVR